MNMAENNLTAEKFLEQFLGKLYNLNATYKGKRYEQIYLHSKEYTNLVNREIVRDILSENGLQHTYEYYRIDVIGWNYIENETLKRVYEKVGLRYHSWKLEFAFEHENLYRDWNDEAIKLLYVNCPLRVIVGYNDADKRDHLVFGDENKLSIVAQTIEKTGIKVQGEFLVILGNRGHGYSLSNGLEKYYGYRAYLFHENSKSFKMIN